MFTTSPELGQAGRIKLKALGIPHVADLQTTGGGHGFAYYNLMA
jgi:hypothetical protein